MELYLQSPQDFTTICLIKLRDKFRIHTTRSASQVGGGFGVWQALQAIGTTKRLLLVGTTYNSTTTPTLKI